MIGVYRTTSNGKLSPVDRDTLQSTGKNAEGQRKREITSRHARMTRFL